MEADVLNALQHRQAYFTGGRDLDGRLLIVVPVPSELQPWTKRNLELALKYLISIINNNSTDGYANKVRGLSVIVDTQKSSPRMARCTVRYVESIVGADAIGDASPIVFVVRPDAFWDHQLVENCARSYKKGETITLPKSRLDKYFNADQLPAELGGTSVHNHEQWLQQRVRIEEFCVANERVLNDLENLQVVLLEHKSARADETAQAIAYCAAVNADVKRTMLCTIEKGHSTVAELTSASPSSTNQTTAAKYPDLLISRERIERHVQVLSDKQNKIAHDWNDFQRNLDAVRELAQLEDSVSQVTNWIMGTAERLLNAQSQIGTDVPSCDALRVAHEALEMQCRDKYGMYAELLHKIKMYPMQPDTFAHHDLMSQRDFMDFVCRSFASRLERRRNVLIASARFYRLVSEYFDRTSEVFETLVMGKKMYDLAAAAENLKSLQESEQSLDKILKELEKEGEKLTDVLSMPIKDALGRDCGIDYNDDICTIRDILDATIARRNIFVDSVQLQKLTLEQVTHIHTYEQDAAVALQWIDDLFAVMHKTHLHVGCNVYEIQAQKEELQTFQETAKGTFNYGCQLLDAAMLLRQSCKLNVDDNRKTLAAINGSWSRLLTVSQEQMTRLRVSAVFHRSIEEHCVRLQELRETVVAAHGCRRDDETGEGGGAADDNDDNDDNDDGDVYDRRACVRKYLIRRERLLVEVGRMVRLGRLLKTRLKEPFSCEPSGVVSETAIKPMTDSKTPRDSDGPPSEPIILSTSSKTLVPSAFAVSSNGIACEAITVKLTEVSKIAESLDIILKELQETLDEEQDNLDATATSKCVQPNEDWNTSQKSPNTTEDELFVTASEGTLQSRSSYRTASEGDPISPWNHFDAESSDIDPEVPTMQLLSGVLSSASASFDDSDRGFVSEQSSPPNPSLSDGFDEHRIGANNVGAHLLAAKVSADPQSGLSHELLNWCTYNNAALTKHAMRGCF